MEERRKRTGVLESRKMGMPSVQESPLYLLKVFILLAAAVIVHTSISPYLTVLGAKPDATLVMVISIAMLRGPVWGASVGFATGLLLDIALVQYMGISSFLYTLAGYFSGRYTEGVDPDSWIPPVITVFISTLVVQVLNSIIMFLIGVEASVGFILLRVVLPAAFLNALLAAPFFIACRWWLGGEQQQSVFSAK